MPVELQFAIRIVAFIIGLLLVLTFARSMVRVALVNHPTPGWGFAQRASSGLLRVLRAPAWQTG